MTRLEYEVRKSGSTVEEFNNEAAFLLSYKCPLESIREECVWKCGWKNNNCLSCWLAEHKEENDDAT